MPLSEKNTRIVITIGKTEKTLLDKLAKQQRRTTSNFCAKILSDYLNLNKDGK